MDNQLEFLFKVFFLSAVISVLIKYAGPFIPIAATSINALIIVLLPAVCMAIALIWQLQVDKQN